MKILVLGTGLQGKAALHDLAQSPAVERVIAADADIDDLIQYVDSLLTDKITAMPVDATNETQVADLMRFVEAVIVLLPPHLSVPTAEIAVDNGCHWLDASYTRPEHEALSEEAAARGIALLPEFGLDPGIDLVLAAEAIRELDEVHEFYSYGAGIPEPAAVDNPLKYKISWSFAGVLRSYNRPARLVREGRTVEIASGDVFAPENVHMVDVVGLGSLEAYANGDVVPYLEPLRLTGVQQAGRYSLRWPGHAAFWKKMAELGFLGERPIQVAETAVVPQQFLHDLLRPQLQYGEDERDVALVRVEVQGRRNGRQERIVYQVMDRRDLATGLLAMQRTVGYTLSIGAQMILRGDIQKRGLLSPVSDVPADIFLAELRQRGISVEHREVEERV
jgi:saccharopine dehydrogenase-like NADP-dependent oxidoreductase